MKLHFFLTEANPSKSERGGRSICFCDPIEPSAKVSAARVHALCPIGSAEPWPS